MSDEVATLRRAIEEALTHYAIGWETRCGIGRPYVDWQYVCFRMAETLEAALDVDVEREGEDEAADEQEREA